MRECLCFRQCGIFQNGYYLCGRVERVEKGEIVEIASIDAVFAQVVENMVAWQKRLGEYPANRTQTNAPLAIARDSTNLIRDPG